VGFYLIMLLIPPINFIDDHFLLKNARKLNLISLKSEYIGMSEVFENEYLCTHKIQKMNVKIIKYT